MNNKDITQLENTSKYLDKTRIEIMNEIMSSITKANYELAHGTSESLAKAIEEWSKLNREYAAMLTVSKKVRDEISGFDNQNKVPGDITYLFKGRCD